MGKAESQVGDPARRLLRAAAYVRMSTERQDYSIENQVVAIGRYAARRGYDVVRTFADPGRSGLTMQQRPGLQQLLAAVESNVADFAVILVYDVSRWGRFQDVDEAGHYEFLCRRAGIAVEYCAEMFDNDGTASSMILKLIKRVMAAEYSRELGEKTLAGQRAMVARGFKSGGMAGFALARQLVDAKGSAKGLLHLGEQKAVATDRVRFVLGPEEQVKLVRWIYRAYVERDMDAQQITNELNRRGILNHLGRRWQRSLVFYILTSQRYAGRYVTHRTTCRLRTPMRPTDPSTWIVNDSAIPPIVDRATFDKAQAVARRRAKPSYPTDAELVVHLQRILARHGKISPALIRRDPDAPSVQTIRYRLGGMLNAYRLAGYQPPRRNWMADKGHPFLAMKQRLMEELRTLLGEMDVVATALKQRSGLQLADGRWISVEIMKQSRQASGSRRWWLRMRKPPQPIARVLILMREQEDSPEAIVVLRRGQWKGYDTWISNRLLARWGEQVVASMVPATPILLRFLACRSK